MKKYNIQNYNRHKTDLKAVHNTIPAHLPDFMLTRDDLIVKYMYLVENLARKFSTSSTASGVLDITDMIQYGYIGLIKAVDKIDENILIDSDDPEKTIKSFISKRVKGTIRRAINIHRGDMKIPEYKLNELRALNIDEEEYDPRVQFFFNQIFESLDKWGYHQGMFSMHHHEIEVIDTRPDYNIDIMNSYLLGIMKKFLTHQQYEVLRLSFGLDTPKFSALEIANLLDMNMATANVRVSQIKREAINKLIASVEPDQIFDLV